MAAILRNIVAGPRQRHPDAGLDLCYVTDKIIATSGPSSTYPQRAYRNPTDALVKFLDDKHGTQWAIWEFRAEGTGYPDSEVHNRIHHFPWPDHHPPPFANIPNILGSMRNWLEDDHSSERVVVVHCKAGKGRSGTVACSYMISEQGWTVEDALHRFTARRMRSGFGAGVSIPSQLRWVGYVDRWSNHGKIYTERLVEVVKLHVWGLRDGVKVTIAGFADEGRVIEDFHVFQNTERIVVDGTAPNNNIFADIAGMNNESGVSRSKTEPSFTGKDQSPLMQDEALASGEQSSSRTNNDMGGGAVIFRPSSRIVLPSNDINVGFERRNKAKYGWAMVTAVAHVWFNCFFEGQGPENGGNPTSDGVFNIDWDAMDGIKGSSRKGIRALDRISVVWRAVDGSKKTSASIITQPQVGQPVPETGPADWKRAHEGKEGLGKDLGLRVESPVSSGVSKANSINSVESKEHANAVDDRELMGVRPHGPNGEDHIAYPGSPS